MIPRHGQAIATASLLTQSACSKAAAEFSIPLKAAASPAADGDEGAISYNPTHQVAVIDRPASTHGAATSESMSPELTLIPPIAPAETATLGVVSFLNALPLYESLLDQHGVSIKPAVPSELSDMLTAGACDAAL